MRLSPIKSNDLAEIKKNLLPLCQKDLCRRFLREVSQTDKAEGLILRSNESDLLGAALVKSNSNHLFVPAIIYRHLNAYETLGNGLRKIAQEKRLGSIWLVSDRDQQSVGAFNMCGLQLMAFFNHGPEDDSAEVQCWRILPC